LDFASAEELVIDITWKLTSDDVRGMGIENTLLCQDMIRVEVERRR